MNFERSIPSLERLALIRTAVTLCNHVEIKTILNSSRFLSERILQDIENKAMEKINQLPQPIYIRKKILAFIKPIALQMLDWKEYLNNFLYIYVDLPSELCWSPQGTIDEKRSAENLVKDENISIASRYELACIYCLEDDIPKLWEKIPRYIMHSFYELNEGLCEKQGDLISFWTHAISGTLTQWWDMIHARHRGHYSSHQYAFLFAARSHNKVATAYFLQKLTPEEKEVCFNRITGHDNLRGLFHYNFRIFKNEYHRGVSTFLFSQMDDVQQANVFRRYPFAVMGALLDWPWQEFFMETAERVWACIAEEQRTNDFHRCYCADFCDVLIRIVDKMLAGYREFDYQAVFRDFWRLSPITEKNNLICNFRSALSDKILPKLIAIDDQESIKLILESASTTQRQEIIFCHRVKEAICESLIRYDKFDLLKFFIQECISSKEVLIEFKDEMIRSVIITRWIGINRSKNLQIQYYIKDKLCQIIEEFLQKSGVKRDLEEGDSSSTKKLCN